MKIYLLTYDNGEPYDMNENYTIGVFDNFNKACKFCKNKGFEETNTHGFYRKEGSVWGTKQRYESICIDEIYLNKELNSMVEVINIG